MAGQFLFVYDLLLNSGALSHLCALSDVAFSSLGKVCNAHLPDYAFCWNRKAADSEYGVANVAGKRNARQHDVWGTVFSVGEDDFQKLGKNIITGSSCRMIEAAAISDSGSRLNVSTYIAEPCADVVWAFPTGAYFGALLEGGRVQGLPDDYLQYLERVTPVSDFVPFKGDSRKKTVIYSGTGVTGRTLKYWQNIFSEHDLGALDILDGSKYADTELTSYDLAILPGGDSREMCAGLGTGGVRALREYVAGGGKLLGVCAGAYAVSHQLPQYLAISPVVIVDYPHAHRGTGTPRVVFNEAGHSLFGVGVGERHPFFYYNGPVPLEKQLENCYDYQVLATYCDELRQPEGEPDTMVGWPAAWRNRYGRGEVFAVSPHIEQTAGKEHIMAHFINSILKRDLFG